MLRQLNLLNFQSHHESTLDFVDGVNVVVGSSDSGKTAIIRALRKLFFNRPLGDSMIRNGEKKMEIELFTDDAHFVYSKDKESEYVLGDTHFKAFSTDVPKEITDALNIGDQNIQNQLDSPFLLSMSAGDVAGFFNKIAHLEQIDKGTSAVNSAIRELNSDIKYKEAQEVKLNEELLTYAHISILESEVEVLENLDKNLTALTFTKDKLNNITVNLRLNAISLSKQSEILKLEKPVNDILALIQQRAQKDLEEVRLDKLVNQIYRNQADIDEKNELLKAEEPVLELLQLYDKRKSASESHRKLSETFKSLRGIQVRIEKENSLTLLESPVISLLKLYDDRKLKVNDKNLLSKIVESIKAVQVRITNGDAFVKTKEAEFEKEMPNICPLCNQPIKHEHTN